MIMKMTTMIMRMMMMAKRKRMTKMRQEWGTWSLWAVPHFTRVGTLGGAVYQSWHISFS